MFYIRDTSSDIYKLENTTNFILGENNYLYVIYPYGNSNYTDEMDVVVFLNFVKFSINVLRDFS